VGVGSAECTSGLGSFLAERGRFQLLPNSPPPRPARCPHRRHGTRLYDTADAAPLQDSRIGVAKQMRRPRANGARRRVWKVRSVVRHLALPILGGRAEEHDELDPFHHGQTRGSVMRATHLLSQKKSYSKYVVTDARIKASDESQTLGRYSRKHRLPRLKVPFTLHSTPPPRRSCLDIPALAGSVLRSIGASGQAGGDQDARARAPPRSSWCHPRQETSRRRPQCVPLACRAPCRREL
jgi:hypothetical protein